MTQGTAAAYAQDIAASKEKLTGIELSDVLRRAFDPASINMEHELLLQSGGMLPESVVREELGEGAVAAFYYLDSLLYSDNRSERRMGAAEKRRHAYDSAYRAARFGFKDDDVAIVLLHDVLEYTSKNLEKMGRRTEEIREKFGDYVAAHTVLLADLNAIITHEIARRMHKDGRKINANSDILAYLQKIKAEMTNSGRRKTDDALKGLENVIGGLNKVHIAMHREYDGFSIYGEIERRIVPLFVENAFRTARQRMEDGQQDYYVPIAARGISYIDSVRTMRGSNALARVEETALFLEKLDLFDKLLERRRIVNNAVHVVYAALKAQVIEQTRAAVKGYLGRDSAFATEAAQLKRQLSALETKYGN